MLKVGIIDDEIDALESLELILNEFFDNIKVEGKANDFDGAIDLIKNKELDILFLDIEMPNADGFDIIKYVDTNKTYVIFVTAYNQYALQAFRTNAIDYILKPIDIALLKAAVTKVENNIKQKQFPDLDEITYKLYRSPKISISSLEGIEYIELEDVIVIEADKSYSIFYLKDRKIISSKNLKYYYDKINDENFYRPHNSYIVNLNHVKRYTYKDSGKIEMSNNMLIPVSRTKRNEFLEKMEEFIK